VLQEMDRTFTRRALREPAAFSSSISCSAFLQDSCHAAA